MVKEYYIDTCIWLNLFKKEGDESKGKPYWMIARDFIDYVAKDNNKIIVSTIILKELIHILGNKFSDAKKLFKESLDFISLVKTSSEDYDLARKLESKYKFSISFYDCLHIALAKRLNVILITRDRDLMDVAKEYITVNKPEDLII